MPQLLQREKHLKCTSAKDRCPPDKRQKRGIEILTCFLSQLVSVKILTKKLQVLYIKTKEEEYEYT